MTTSIANNRFSGKILIIGGGIGGNALALFLQKVGIDCAVYEAYTPKEGMGGGLGLAPNGMNVLAALGLAEETKRRGTMALENTFYNQRGDILARIKNGDPVKFGQPGMSLIRATLHDILREAVVERGIHIHIEYEKRLMNITCDENTVTAHFEDGTQASGDLLIGADGVHSKTRHTILPNAPEPAYVGIVGVGGYVPASAVPNMTLREKQSFSFTYGANGFFGYGGAGNGDMYWWANLTRDREMSRDEMTKFTVDELIAEMLSIYGDFHDPIPAMIRSTQRPLKHNIFDILSLPTWHQGRILLIGDAAHAVSPNSGQGASMALEDAMYLAKLLKSCGDYEQVFAQFEAHRKPRVEAIVAEGRRRGNDKDAVSPFQQKIRELMLRIFVNLFGVKGLNQVYEYKIDWN
jgi:2-polyprenyl-6-methoxyphenol hydroxylase-like FAD-dependent oxidoreductase